MEAHFSQSLPVFHTSTATPTRPRGDSVERRKLSGMPAACSPSAIDSGRPFTSGLGRATATHRAPFPCVAPGPYVRVCSTPGPQICVVRLRYTRPLEVGACELHACHVRSTPVTVTGCGTLWWASASERNTAPPLTFTTPISSVIELFL